MSYIPTVWQNGDVITAEKLNKLENGVGSDMFVAHFEVTWDENENMNVVTCDKTAEEILDAYVSNEFVCAKILFFQTNPEVTTFDITGYDSQEYKELQILSYRVFVDDSTHASEGDAFIRDNLNYDFVHEQWQLYEAVYALTPFPANNG